MVNYSLLQDYIIINADHAMCDCIIYSTLTLFLLELVTMIM